MRTFSTRAENKGWRQAWRSFLSRSALPALLIAAGIALAFLTRWKYLHRAYFLDDFGLLAQGPLHLADLPRIFSPIGIDWFYRPVAVVYTRTMTSFFGGAGYPRHLFSLVLFGVNAGLAAWLAARLTQRTAAAWLTLILFVTAPGMEEAIWWFASTSTLIASLFSFLAVHLWICWRRSAGRIWAAAAGICVVIAMCSKEDAAFLPLMLAVLDGWLVPRQALHRRIIPLAWLMSWSGLWLGLDLAAYQHVSAHVSTARLWRPDIVYRLNLTGSFAYRTLVASLVGTITTLPPWCAALAVAALAWRRALKHPMLIAGACCAILAAIPIPLASGQHVSSERFAYYPEAWAAVMGSVFIITAISSPQFFTFLAGVSLLLLFLFLRIPLPKIDPIWLWCALLFCGIGTGYGAVRLRRQKQTALLIASVSLAGALAQALSGSAFYDFWVFGVALLSAALTGKLGCPLEGGVCGIALMASAPWTLPFYLFAVAFPNLVRDGLAARPTGEHAS